MDAVLQAAFQSAPQLGAMGGFLWLVLLLLRREATSEDRHAAEMARISTAHDTELGELRSDVAELRKEIDEVNRKLDAERGVRRRLEDELAAAKRGTGTTL